MIDFDPKFGPFVHMYLPVKDQLELLYEGQKTETLPVPEKLEKLAEFFAASDLRIGAAFGFRCSERTLKLIGPTIDALSAAQMGGQLGKQNGKAQDLVYILRSMEMRCSTGAALCQHYINQQWYTKCKADNGSYGTHPQWTRREQVPQAPSLGLAADRLRSLTQKIEAKNAVNTYVRAVLDRREWAVDVARIAGSVVACLERGADLSSWQQEEKGFADQEEQQQRTDLLDITQHFRNGTLWR